MNAKEKYSLNMHLARFGTDQACHDHLIQVRWNGKPQCPKCRNNHMNYFLSKRKIYKCSQCSKQFKATTGTIFERSKLSLSVWFQAIYFFTTAKRGLSSCQMAKLLGIQQRSAWFLLQRLRTALKDENEIVLNGIVETDETFVGPDINRDKRLQAKKKKHFEEQKRLGNLPQEVRLRLGIKHKQGRKKGSTKEVLKQKQIERGGKPYVSTHLSPMEQFETGVFVLGMMERDGKIVMKKIGRNRKCLTADNIQPYLRKHISANSILVTDELSAYNGASDFFAEHQTVNHEVGYVVNDVHNNSIENAWNHLKRMVDGTYFHMSYHHFDKYLHENSFRWNRRLESLQYHFDSFIPFTSNKAVTYRKLTETRRLAA